MHDVTVYDASFMALARQEKVPLITADYRFFDRVKGEKYMLRLSDLPRRGGGRK